jgi:hypothetical protein
LVFGHGASCTAARADGSVRTEMWRKLRSPWQSVFPPARH